MGVDVRTIIQTLAGVIKLASQAQQAGKDIEPFAMSIYETLVKGKDVSDADLEELRRRSDALHNELQAPLPPDR